SRSAESPRVVPLAPERFGLHFTIDNRTRNKLRYAEELLSHQIRPGDLAGLFDRALDALIREAEKRKFAATRAPRARRPVRSVRPIPARVKRAVWERDGGRAPCAREGAGARGRALPACPRVLGPGSTAEGRALRDDPRCITGGAGEGRSVEPQARNCSLPL